METNEEKLDRLGLMVNDKNGKWDLSDNDIEAIKYALSICRADALVTKSEQPKASQASGAVAEDRLKEVFRKGLLTALKICRKRVRHHHSDFKNPNKFSTKAITSYRLNEAQKIKSEIEKKLDQNYYWI